MKLLFKSWVFVSTFTVSLSNRCRSRYRGTLTRKSEGPLSLDCKPSPKLQQSSAYYLVFLNVTANKIPRTSTLIIFVNNTICSHTLTVKSYNKGQGCPQEFSQHDEIIGPNYSHYIYKNTS